jgi:hypothetical protein
MTTRSRKARQGAEEDRPDGPNADARASSVRWAVRLAVVALLAASAGKLTIPAGRYRTLAVLTGGPLVLMLGALACGVIALLSVAVQSLSRSAHHRAYEAFRWLILWLGGAFAASSLIAHLYLGVRG